MLACTCSPYDRARSRLRLGDFFIWPVFWFIRPYRCTSCGKRFYALRRRYAKRPPTEQNAGEAVAPPVLRESDMDYAVDVDSDPGKSAPDSRPPSLQKTSDDLKLSSRNLATD